MFNELKKTSTNLNSTGDAISNIVPTLKEYSEIQKKTTSALQKIFSGINLLLGK